MRPYELKQNYLNTRYNYSLPKNLPIPQKYPQDIQCVLISKDPSKGSIYISNVEAAENTSTLNKYQINAVMTCARGYDRNIAKSRLEMYEYFPFDDKESCVIAPYFDKGADFIVKALQKTNILVHCIAGVSRSVSMVLAFFIREKGMSYQQAYHHVKSHRKIIHPNDGFIQQLKRFAIEVSEKKHQSSKQCEIKEREQTYTPTKRSSHQDDRHFQTIQHAKTSDFGKMLTRNDIMNDEQTIENTDIKYLKSHSFLEHNPKQAVSKRDTYYGNMRNNSTHIIKSSTLINENKQQDQTIEKKQSQKYGDRTQYYQKMNQQLNHKIQAIHQKYQKQRQQLMTKRQSSNHRNDRNSLYTPPRRVQTNQKKIQTEQNSHSFQVQQTPKTYRDQNNYFKAQQNLSNLREKSFSFTSNQNLRFLRQSRNSSFQKQPNNRYQMIYDDYRYKGFSPYQKNNVKYGGSESHYWKRFKYAEMSGMGNQNFGIIGRGMY